MHWLSNSVDINCILKNILGLGLATKFTNCDNHLQPNKFTEKDIHVYLCFRKKLGKRGVKSVKGEYNKITNAFFRREVQSIKTNS